MQQLIIVSVYFTVLLGVGWWSRGRVQSRDGFFVAGRKGTTLLVTGSLLATVAGGSATVGVAGLGFEQGLTGVWWLLVGCIGLSVLGFFFSARVRRLALYSLPFTLYFSRVPPPKAQRCSSTDFLSFIIGTSSLIRHSGFLIRHLLCSVFLFPAYADLAHCIAQMFQGLFVVVSSDILDNQR